VAFRKDRNEGFERRQEMISRVRAAIDAFRNPLHSRSAVLWDAAGRGNRLSGWSAPSSNFASIVTPAILLQRARDEYRNSGWMRRAVELLAVDAVGGGIKPQFRSENRRAAQAEFDRWSEQADATGRFDLYGLENLVVQTTAIDGECLVRIVPAPGLRVPIQLQVLGCEFLDSSRVDDRTLNGIEYNTNGRRVAYWLYQKHPATFPDMRSVRIPAEQVCHLFRPVQPGVERGVSWLAPALLPSRELREYFEAQLTKQKISALFCGFAISPDGSNPLNAVQGANGFTASMEPGTMALLNGTQSVEFAEPPGCGDFDPFVRAQLRLIASALNVPYELLAGDLSGVTFASGRHALLAYRRVLEFIQHHLMVHQLLRPVLATWLRMATALDILPGTPDTYNSVRWIGPVLSALDPKAETQAQIMRVRAGFTSRSEVVSQDGWDSETIDDENEQDRAREESKGLVYDTNPAKTTLQGQEQQSAAQEQVQ
jgi:lambda family phage portal protein